MDTDQVEPVPIETDTRPQEPVESTAPVIELAIVKGPSSGVFVLTETGVKISDDTSFEQWHEGLKTIRWFRNKIAIGLADYIEWGTIRFGKEKVVQVLEQLEFDANFVKTAITITEIPTELRFPNLNGDHYVEIAKANLTKPKQMRWAKIASEQQLSPSQLRFSIKENEVVDKSAAKALQSGVITIHGIRQQFDVWLKRVGGLEGILKMDVDHKEEIMGELESIFVLAIQLKEHLAKPAAA